MLDITKINSVSVFNEDWRKARLGKITASNVSKLISKNSDKGEFTQGAITYLENLAGETVTGLPSTEEFFTNATNHGNACEPIGIRHFCEHSLELVGTKYWAVNDDRGDTHRLIVHDELESCTPDALLSKHENLEKAFDSTGNFLDIIPFELKCPPVHHRFIKLYKCKTAHELLAASDDYAWQLIDQMRHCGSLKGIFACYHPDFPNPMRTIVFKKTELVSEFKKIEATIHYAKIELNKIVNDLKS